MGTGSDGWAVTDGEGRLLHFKKQPTWGSRLFDSAETAASARIPRSQRRRYVRRRWRLDLLQGLLQEEVEKVDPDFFLRLRQSRLVDSDPNKTTAAYRWPIFNETDFTKSIITTSSLRFTTFVSICWKALSRRISALCTLLCITL